MRRFHPFSKTIVAFLAALSASLTAIGGGFDEYKLSKAIPADVFLAVHTRSHPGQDFLKKQYARIWAAVEAAQFDKDIRRIFRGLAEKDGPEAVQEFDARWQQVSDLASGVEWSTLGEKEFAFAMKLEFPMPQFVFLMEPPADKIKPDFEGLSAILESIAQLAPTELALTKDEQGDSVVHKLGFTNAPFPAGMTLARHKSILMIGMGATMPEQVLTMLDGKGGKALSTTPRFTQAFSKLPAPKDEAVFFDVSLLMTQVRGVMNAVKQMNAGGSSTGDETGTTGGAAQPSEAELAMSIVGKIIDAADMVDYLASVKTTDGMKSTEDFLCAIKDSAKSSPLYAPLFNNGPISEPLKFVPQSAGNVSVWRGIDVSALYGAILKFVNEHVPDGAEHVAQFKAMQEQQGVDVEKDYLNWIGGGFISFSIPGKTQYSPAEWAVLITVKDEAKGRETINKLLDILGANLAQQGGSVAEAQIEGGEGFRSVIFPMLAMLGMTRPTLGFAQGHMFFGSSPKVIEQSLAAASGKEPNFSKNERFLKEGIQPKGSVTSLSFSDTSRTGQEMGQLLKMVPMVAMLPGMNEVFQDPSAKAVLGVISKLGPIVEKLDFMLSEASVSTFDGKVFMTKSVSNFREPPPPATPKSSDSKSDAEPKNGEKKESAKDE